jgi:hypothetical protein
MKRGRKRKEPPPVEGAMTATNAARAAGITYRQLDHWRKTGVVNPRHRSPGTGNPEWWDPDEVSYLIAVADLNRVGIDLRPLRKTPTPAGVRRLCQNVTAGLDEALAVLPNPNRVTTRRQVPSE